MMIKTIMNVGRATVFAIGFAVMLAVVLGVATTANAKAGDPLKLGRLNTVNQLTQLVGSVAGPSLRIDNNSTGVGATALRLEVEPGKPPMSVNSTTEVNGLNVDSIDSLNSSDFLQESSDRDDFLPSRTYNKSGSVTNGSKFAERTAEVSCDTGDIALSGGYTYGFDGGADGRYVSAERTSGATYSVSFVNPEFDDSLTPNVTCADFPPLR